MKYPRVVRFLLEYFFGSVPNSGKLWFRYTEDLEMAQGYDVYAPTDNLMAQDIVGGETLATVTRGGVTTTVAVAVGKPVPGESEILVGHFESDDATTARFEHVWIDDAGNRSEVPSVLEWVVSDTTPPDNPGSLVARNQVEIPD